MRPSHHSVRLRPCQRLQPLHRVKRRLTARRTPRRIADRYPRLPRAFAGTLSDFFSEPASRGSYEGA